MPIDFLNTPCTKANGNCKIVGVTCKSSTTNTTFGLCDKTPPPSLPAYIDTANTADWIAEVKNVNSKTIFFKAIDACVDIFRPSGEMESRCDGVLIDGNILTFVELKDRASGGWVSKGRKQLTITINNFIANDPNSANFNMVEAYVCNKQRPLAVTSINTESQQFKNETGLTLKVNRTINI
ncbi:hypothetical protein [Flavobacterium aquatile]|uniref:hypothetical protein n=1 Tax=Flavobacterium aquatile TaxID=245 RepID=UPI00069260E4|nr:hypothetical protein [Flavobacterium aquatile]GEC78021.1 hypothetical protein FAQ01_08910 [Flavobacterium aquatile]